MSDKDLEKAREIFENHEKSHHGKVILLCPSAACIGAQGFLDGHASRDPEVAALKAELEKQYSLVKQFYLVMDAQDACTATDLHAELSAEREASRKLFRTVVFFASVIKSGERWTEHCETAYREAVKVATPGHSPEGRTL